MAFSYSDNNFTVIGNLCFVHIILDGTEADEGPIDIPPAIADRMLFSEINCTEPSGSSYAVIYNGAIYLTVRGLRYLNVYFPIDSNK